MLICVYPDVISFMKNHGLEEKDLTRIKKTVLKIVNRVTKEIPKAEIIQIRNEIEIQVRIPKTKVALKKLEKIASQLHFKLAEMLDPLTTESPFTRIH